MYVRDATTTDSAETTICWYRATTDTTADKVITELHTVCKHRLIFTIRYNLSRLSALLLRRRIRYCDEFEMVCGSVSGHTVYAEPAMKSLYLRHYLSTPTL